MTDSSHIKVQCPHCQGVIVALDGPDGGVVRCVSCGKRFRIPHSITISTIQAPEAARGLPTLIDHYQVRALLGQGTFGSVYRAFDLRLQRDVALKVLKAEMTASPQAVERILREARAAAKLQHPHIVPVHHIVHAGPVYYIVSAFIRGRTLDSAVPEGGMEPRQAAELTAQLASALGYAHRQGLVHRDVKPANAMLDEQGSLHLMDFGLAGWTQQASTKLTKLGAVMGTPAYMAPEQAGGATSRVGPASDLYSAGVVLYELLTGRLPFEGSHAGALLYKIVTMKPPPPSQYRPGLDARLEAICLKALAKDPAQRYQSGEAMAAALRGVLAPAVSAPKGDVDHSFCHFRLHGLPHQLSRGETVVATLIFGPRPEPETTDLQIPAGALELVVCCQAEGFHLEGDHIRTVPLVEGAPVQSGLTFHLTAIRSGDFAVKVRARADGAADPARWTFLQRPIQVTTGAPSVSLSNSAVPEEIPDPQPDLVLHALFEATGATAPMSCRLTCPALGMDRAPIDPPVVVSELFTRLPDQGKRPASVFVFGGVGKSLFDILMPEGHALRRIFLEEIAPRAAGAQRPWSLLIVSDDKVSLPWEALFAGPDRRRGFLAEHFAIGHWISGRGLPLAVDAPLAAPVRLGDPNDGWTVVETDYLARRCRKGALGPAGAGLHFVGRLPCAKGALQTILSWVVHFWGGKGEKATDADAFDAWLDDRRVEFLRTRPVVLLSILDESSRRPAGQPAPSIDLQSWVLPLLHAGATAVVGPRWPVGTEAGQIFARAFTRSARGGTPLGHAVREARAEVRRLSSDLDWLAFTYFGHPECQPYEVRAAHGFALFEALSQSADTPFRVGQTYDFRASFRAEAPVWYRGPVQAPRLPLPSDLTVTVIPVGAGMARQTHPLIPLAGGRACVCVLRLTVPSEPGPLPLLIRFHAGAEELRRLELTLDVVPLP